MNKKTTRTTQRLLTGALFGAAMTLGSAPAHAENMCVAPKIEAELNKCDGLAGAFKKGGSPSAPKSVLATATKRKKLGAGQGPTKPGFELDPATRRNREKIQKKAWALLQKEEKIAKRLADRTRTSDPQRPKILLRLAETQFEMQVHLTEKVRSYDEPMFQARRANNKSKLKQLRAAQVRAEQALKQKREEAIRTYATIVKDHEDFARMDEVLFSLAFGLEELRQYDRARQVYKRMIKKFPQSRFVPHAYLSFAEVYFAGDPDNGVEANMAAAMKFYNKVLEFPPAKNPVYGYAKYKSAWAAYNLDRFKDSLQAFVEVIEFAESNPHANDAENLARQSRRELVMPYAQVGTPNKALDFFRRYSKKEESAIDTFESLGELYFDTGQWGNATTVFQRLIAEKPNDDRVCSWQGKIALATVSEKNKEDRVREVKRLVDVLEKFKNKKGASKSALKECKQTAAGMTLELATAWHREAIGTDNQPGTNNRDTMKYSAELYRLALEKFPDMDKIEFPQFHKDDWPTQYRVSYYHAELLWKMEQWTTCGPAFDRVVEINPRGEYTNDAAYAAVLCYNNLYQEQYAARERMTRRDEERKGGKKGKKGKKEEEENRFKRKEFGKTEQGMLNAFQRYLCVVKEADELVQIKYRRGRIYYENNHFEEAAVLFRDIALKHPNHELAEYAANLYLDTLNVMGTMIEQPKVACVEELEGATAELGPKYCQPQAKKDEHEQLCGVLDALRCNVYRKKAETYHANKQFKESGREYDRILNDRTCHNVENPETGEPLVQIDEVLWNAALEYEAANLLGKAISRRKVLIDKLPDSPLAKKAIYLVGANYHAIAAYEEAASYYEQFARKFPGEMGKDCTKEEKKNNLCPIAHEALKDAIFFRSALNQANEAEADVKLYEKNFKRKFTQEASQVKYGLGSVYERAGDKRAIIRHYEDYLKSYKRKGLAHQIVKAHVIIGKIRWNANEKSKAEKEFKAALRAGKGKRGTASSPEEKAKWEAQTKDAMSEALFYLAEDEYRAFKAIKFPAYRGGKSMKRVNEWSKKEFKGWIEKKLKAVKAAQKAYEKIAELEIPPWEIAAAARIGEMWRSFVDEFRDAPIPKEIEKDPELFDIYVGALDDASKPFVVEAKDKFEFCLITATKVRWFSDFSRQCEEELNRLDPREYPLSAEIRDGATHVLDTYGRPVPVELTVGDEPQEGSL